MRLHILIASFTFALIPATRADPPTTAAEITAIAREAYVWGYPTVDLYAILHAQVLDPDSPEYKGTFNRVGHVRDVATPDDKVVIAPNVDTPYSYAWLDLRAGPVVITMPPFEESRYMSMALFDCHTWITGYITPRTQGNGGGDFLVVGPDWQGDPPPGLGQLFRSPTTLALGLFRTQLLGSSDLSRVHALQDSIRVRTLSEYLKEPLAPPLPFDAPVTPVNLREEPFSPRFFTALNWMLTYMPELPEEATMRKRFARIGIVAGRPFEPADEDAREAVVQGMRQGMEEMVERATRVKSSAELFGSREYLGRDYTVRAVGAMLGILGNAAEEYLGPGYQADADGRAFDGKHRYEIKFPHGGEPPVDAFWSLTAYGEDRLLYANPIDRQVINSSDVPKLRRDPDGGFTIYLQHESPGLEREANWLPVPATPFVLTLRCYLPREPIRSGSWTPPPVRRLP